MDAAMAMKHSTQGAEVMGLPTTQNTVCPSALQQASHDSTNGVAALDHCSRHNLPLSGC